MKSIKIEIPQGFQIDEEKSTFTNIVFKPIEKKWVDLGLPSGTLWCDINEDGYYSWNEMMNKFDEENLPKLTDFAELYDYCKWKWNDKKKGMSVTGPNGNKIFIPALGHSNYNNNNRPTFVNITGLYWSASPCTNFEAYYLVFDNKGCIGPAGTNLCTHSFTIRCIKRTK